MTNKKKQHYSITYGISCEQEAFLDRVATYLERLLCFVIRPKQQSHAQYNLGEFKRAIANSSEAERARTTNQSEPSRITAKL